MKFYAPVSELKSKNVFSMTIKDEVESKCLLVILIFFVLDLRRFVVCFRVHFPIEQQQQNHYNKILK